MNDTKEHILNISSQLFLQKSYKEVTMKELVEKSGMSKGAFYHYFENKEQLFVEVINKAISAADIDYKKLSKASLYQFYHDYINHIDQTMTTFEQNSDSPENNSGWNYYSMIIEAFKFVPGFQQKFLESQQVELKAWKEMVCTARNAGEIRSSMSDEQIASLFIYTAEGMSVRNIMNGKSKAIAESLLVFWDSLYLGLKV